MEIEECERSFIIKINETERKKLIEAMESGPQWDIEGIKKELVKILKGESLL